MPAVVFNPLAAVIVHSQVPVNPLTFQLLEGEDALLVHRCTRAATRQEWTRYNRRGKMIVFVRHSPLLTYSVQATALNPTGENLGNYHPGRCLSDRALDFVNGGRTPFQFEAVVEGVVPGKFILKDPVQEPGAGDATEVSFSVVHAFIDLDVEEYPGGSSATPGEPTTFVDLATQENAALLLPGFEALLADFFRAADSFAVEPLTLAFWSAAPGAGGVALTDALPLTPWTSLSEVDSSPDIDTAIARNDSLLTWMDASSVDRVCTHLVWQRNGIAVAALELDEPLTIPAYDGVRIPVDCCGIRLRWYWAASGSPLPATTALRYLLGHTDTGVTPAAATLTVECYSDDPSGSGVLQTSFAVARDSTWTISSWRVGNGVTLTGPAAPGGGWSTTYVRVLLSGVATPLCEQFLSGTISTAAGDAITLAAGVIEQDLA